MELQSISQVSKQFCISSRTLRYYEQIGLITSTKKDDFAYRTYDEDTILRLRQIIILRKLRIPLKQIAEILKSDNVDIAIKTFENNLYEIEDEITALSTIKNIIRCFINKLNLDDAKLKLLDDENLLEIIDSLTISKINFKENMTMNELNQASQKLNKLTDKDVRIIYLPPTTVASYQYMGDEPEMHCNEVIDKFVLETELIKIKPDTRHYGFNVPNLVDGNNYHGYEVWVTIPDDMEVPSYIEKKHFKGGQYAAHMIQFGNFEEWEWLLEWVQNNDKYEKNCETKSNHCLEEHLNYINHVKLLNTEPEGMQLDLLYPIKERTK